MAVNLFLPEQPTDSYYVGPPKKVDPRNAQLDLEGFLGVSDAAAFAEELWDLMIDAQSQPQGIPKVLLEKKKAEMAKAKAAPEMKTGSLVGLSKGAAMSADEKSEADRLRSEALKRAEAARTALLQKQNNDPQRSYSSNGSRRQEDYYDERRRSRDRYYRNENRSRSRSRERYSRYDDRRSSSYRTRSRSRSRERR